jgi:hypothetical protein
MQGNTSCDEAPELSAPLAQQSPASPELARVIDAWPGLPTHVRAAILALVQTARQG